MSRLVNLIVSRRSSWVVALLGLALAVGTIVGVGQAERDASSLDQLPAGFESTQGQALLDELPDEGTKTAIVLFTVDGDGITEQLPELATVLEDVAPDGAEAPAEGEAPAGGGSEGAGPPEGVETGGEGEQAGGPPPGVADGAFPVIPAEDGSAAIGVLTLDAPTSSDARDAVAELRTALDANVPAGVTAQVTGPAGIEADLASVFDGANVTLLAVTASVVALLLIITYRSPVLWIVPLTVVGAADQAAASAATYVLKTFGVPWDESTIGILSVLVFGAGTNYALLLISRYRDELRLHEDRYEAMRVALRRVAEPIIFSASTVVVGVLCLLLSVFPSTRGLGLASAVGVLVAMVAVLVILPAALVIFGRWIFWPQVPREGQSVLADSQSLWRRIGDTVAKAPVAYIAGTLAVLGAMAFGLTQIQSGLAQEDQFLETPEAITAAQRLGESFPAGASDPVLVVTRTDDAAVLEDIAGTVGEVDGVDQATALEPQEGIGQVQVVLSAEPGSDEARSTVEEVRAAVAGSEAPEAFVTGGDASGADADAGSVQDRWKIMPLILAGVLLALAGLLRSVLAPVILVSSVVATFAAALGVSWWLFSGVFDFGAVDASMPLLAFVFLVALGVDYNIFLITRTLEEAGVHGTREGVLRALGATGGVITSAGILLAAVFAVLGVLPLVVLAQIGVVICIGVLLDTLVVRTILVPAIVRVLGERFWWPRRVGPVAAAEAPRHSEEYVDALG
jgi:putative drug exporter of the RND superfamily